MHTVRLFPRVVPAVMPVLLASCADGVAPICTSELRWGLAVSVIAPPAAEPDARGTMLLAIDGAFRDSVDLRQTVTLVARPTVRFLSRPGTYTVRVLRDGYRPWERTGVRVQEGRCGIEEVALRAVLEPTP